MRPRLVIRLTSVSGQICRLSKSKSFGVALLAFGISMCRATAIAGPTDGASGPALTGKIAAGNVDAERIRQDARVGANWMLGGRTFSAQRFSPLRQINDRTVPELGVAWSSDIPSPDGLEATPIVVDGAIYISGSQDMVEALDAGTGRLIWRWRPAHLDLTHIFAAWAGRINRGVAVWKGKVFVATADCRLFALSASEGARIWETRTCDPSQGYGIDGVPLVVKNMVVIGNGGADFGAARGYVSAYDIETGRLIWRFYTVPGDPSKGVNNEPILQSAARTWKGKEWWKNGGGNAWESIVYDPELNQVYFGTDTDSVPVGQNGDALFTNSIVALEADTGRFRWAYQEVPNDVWDYDATTPIIQADLMIKGKMRKVLMQAPRDGFFYVIDRQTGKLLAANPFVKVTWASRIDLGTGRPVLTRYARFYLNRRRSALLWPGVEGAHNWQSMSFSPLTGLVYTPAINAPSLYYMNHSEAEWKMYLPGRRAKVQPDGRLIAWDPVRNKPRWSIRLKYPYNGGTLATAGNLVFEGTAQGVFTARRATDGRLLWSEPVVSATQAAPVTYLYQGKQYVLLPVGASGDARLYVPEYGDPPSANGPARLIAFSLGARGIVPRGVNRKPSQPKPPPQTASPAVIARGKALFMRTEGCWLCHGAQLNVPAGASAPDLRYLPSAIFSAWNQIVIGGALGKSAGMPSFQGELSPSDAQAIRAFVIDQAWKLYESEHHEPGSSRTHAHK